MVLEFKTYELKEDSRMYKLIFKNSSQPNEFIIVGEELVGKKLDCFKALQLDDEGMSLIGGLTVDEFAYTIEKEDLKVKSDKFGYIIQELDIPKEYLTMDIIENIQRLNS